MVLMRQLINSYRFWLWLGILLGTAYVSIVGSMAFLHAQEMLSAREAQVKQSQPNKPHLSADEIRAEMRRIGTEVSDLQRWRLIHLQDAKSYWRDQGYIHCEIPRAERDFDLPDASYGGMTMNQAIKLEAAERAKAVATMGKIQQLRMQMGRL